MKILLCTTAYDHAITGAGRVACMVGSWHSYAPEHEVFILSEDCTGSNEYNYTCAIDQWCKLPVLGFYFKSRKYASCLKRILENRKFDVIIHHDIWLAHGARKFLKKHEDLPAWVAFIHDDSTLDMPRGFRLNGRSLSHLMRWLLQEFVIRKLDVVITNSEYMKSRIVEKYRCVVVERLYYTAYDYSKIEFRWNERARDSPVRILFAKNDFIRGGLKELLAALRILDAHTFILTIAGPSEDDVVKKLSKSLRNTRHVEVVFRGPVTTASEMVGLYHQHDLLCIPSRKEALGLAIAEAVACGTPVITTTAGGIREVMNGDNNGFLSAPGDIAGLVANLRECLSDRKETHRKTLAGRKFILERFDINTMFQTLDSILNASMSSVGPDYTPVKSA